MARKRASKSADNSQEVCRPKKNKIQDEKAGKAKNKGNKGKIACASDRKVKGKLPPKHKEIKTNTRTMTAKENGTIPFKKKKNKDEKSKNKQSLSKQCHENDSNKRKASTSNLAPRTKKKKEDIVNSTCNTNTTPEKKIVNCKSSPKKGLKNEKPIQALQEDLDLLKDTKQDDDNDVVNPDSGEESEDEIEWEDVQEAEGQHGNSQALCPSSATPKSEDKNVEISIEIPGMKGKKRKRVQEDLMTKIQKAMNKFQKEIQLEKHKVHLLLLISVGFHRNAVCNQPCFQAFCLSYLPLQFVNKSINKWQSSDVADFLAWFKDDFPSLQKLNFGLLKVCQSTVL
ncbi:DNA repair protein complementing XP-C cells homolog [Exaiptasia diaphana]|uniref:Uncharacterized protein n=1 Tax=Exaiptasia diaphana TaxID=2652724 RepID=A0A913XYY1_EXADI|nr:DNA repair protein complementing XP-C cells homolog [Exaiptasia diaphana]